MKVDHSSSISSKQVSSKASDGFNDSADEEEEEDEEDDEDILIKPSDLIVSLIRLETSVT